MQSRIKGFVIENENVQNPMDFLYTKNWPFVLWILTVLENARNRYWLEFKKTIFKLEDEVITSLGQTSGEGKMEDTPIFQLDRIWAEWHLLV